MPVHVPMIKESLCLDVLLWPDPMSYLGLIKGFLILVLLKNDILLCEGEIFLGSLTISTVKSKKNYKIGEHHVIKNLADIKKEQSSEDIYHTLSACRKTTVPITVAISGH